MTEEKIKATRKEIEAMYDIQEEPKQEVKEETNADVTFEEFTLVEDEIAMKKYKEDLD